MLTDFSTAAAYEAFAARQLSYINDNNVTTALARAHTQKAAYAKIELGGRFHNLQDIGATQAFHDLRERLMTESQGAIKEVEYRFGGPMKSFNVVLWLDDPAKHQSSFWSDLWNGRENLGKVMSPTPAPATT